MYSRAGAWLAYAPIFGAQGFALWQTWSRPPAYAWIASGCAIFACGFGLRLWSVRTLGRFFTMEIGIREGHELVERGPYRVLRHPSYTGYLLILAGIAVAYRSWIALAVPVAVTGIFLASRIRQEERMLAQAFGPAYFEYRKRTYRLIPYVF